MGKKKKTSASGVWDFVDDVEEDILPPPPVPAPQYRVDWLSCPFNKSRTVQPTDPVDVVQTIPSCSDEAGASREGFGQDADEETVLCPEEVDTTIREEIKPPKPGGLALQRCLFTWCLECLRHDLVAFGQDSKSEMAMEGIAPIYCGQCRRRASNRLKSKAIKTGLESLVEGLRIHVHAWAGTEAKEIARVVMSRELEVVAEGKTTKWIDVQKLWESLGPEDTMVSINAEGFREGKREGLVSDCLRGGLI